MVDGIRVLVVDDDDVRARRGRRASSRSPSRRLNKKIRDSGLAPD
jgi:hypothetical protein